MVDVDGDERHSRALPIMPRHNAFRRIWEGGRPQPDATMTVMGRKTALQHAARAGLHSCMDTLLQAGADVNGKLDRTLTSPMYLAIENPTTYPSCITLAQAEAVRSERAKHGRSGRSAARSGHQQKRNRQSRESVEDLATGGRRGADLGGPPTMYKARSTKLGGSCGSTVPWTILPSVPRGGMATA